MMRWKESREEDRRAKVRRWDKGASRDQEGKEGKKKKEEEEVEEEAEEDMKGWKRRDKWQRMEEKEGEDKNEVKWSKVKKEHQKEEEEEEEEEEGRRWSSDVIRDEKETIWNKLLSSSPEDSPSKHQEQQRLQHHWLSYVPRHQPHAEKQWRRIR